MWVFPFYSGPILFSPFYFFSGWYRNPILFVPFYSFYLYHFILPVLFFPFYCLGLTIRLGYVLRYGLTLSKRGGGQVIWSSHLRQGTCYKFCHAGGVDPSRWYWWYRSCSHSCPLSPCCLEQLSSATTTCISG